MNEREGFRPFGPGLVLVIAKPLCPTSQSDTDPFSFNSISVRRLVTGIFFIDDDSAIHLQHRHSKLQASTPAPAPPIGGVQLGLCVLRRAAEDRRRGRCVPSQLHLRMLEACREMLVNAGLSEKPRKNQAGSFLFCEQLSDLFS